MRLMLRLVVAIKEDRIVLIIGKPFKTSGENATTDDSLLTPDNFLVYDDVVPRMSSFGVCYFIIVARCATRPKPFFFFAFLPGFNITSR